MSFSPESSPVGRYLRRLSKGFSLFPLLARLCSTKGPGDPVEVAEFALRTPVIRPKQVPSELIQFASMVANKKPRSVLEIGTNLGGTLFVLCRLADPSATLISLDLPGGRFGGGYKWFQALLFQHFPSRAQRLHLIRDDSHKLEVWERVTAILHDRKLDLLFIDGDHTYQGVRADFEMYSPLVETGGMIVFHDIVQHPADLECGVSHFWREIRIRYRHEEITENLNQGWAGIGVLFT
jgi:predicted O-methyltransferase YrrM